VQRAVVIRICVSQIFLLVLNGFISACSTLPRSGPTTSDVYQSSFHNIPIIPITAVTSELTKLDTFYPWIYSHNVPAISYEILDVDDRVDVYIWENASERLYAGNQQDPSNLGPLVISASGTIDIPYVGKVKAAGNTVDQLQRILILKLKNKVINPQIIVKKVDGFSKKVSIQGIVAKPGLFEITAGRHDLISLLAEAGGSILPPQLTEVVLERNHKKFKTTLWDVYQKSHQNTNLYPQDKIILSEINQTFTSLGATQVQKLIKFPKSELSLIEAIALAEGLSDETANPSHVFLLRYEKNRILHSLVPNLKITTNRVSPVIYELNMRQMQAVFSAQHFQIRNADLIITTEAPYTNVRKILSSLSPVIGLGSSTMGSTTI
jgi:polysaccharide export outer membrane protein